MRRVVAAPVGIARVLALRPVIAGVIVFWQVCFGINGQTVLLIEPPPQIDHPAAFRAEGQRLRPIGIELLTAGGACNKCHSGNPILRQAKLLRLGRRLVFGFRRRGGF